MLPLTKYGLSARLMGQTDIDTLICEAAATDVIAMADERICQGQDEDVAA
jgi:hypothetical protein